MSHTRTALRYSQSTIQNYRGSNDSVHIQGGKIEEDKDMAIFPIGVREPTSLENMEALYESIR